MHYHITINDPKGDQQTFNDWHKWD